MEKSKELSDYEDALEVVKQLIDGCYDSKNVPLDCRTKDISKIIFERYTNAITGTLKIFKFSKGKEGNNHPYIFEMLLTREQFNEADDSLAVVRDYGLSHKVFGKKKVNVIDSLPCADCGLPDRECYCAANR